MNRVVLMSAGAALALSLGGCDRAAAPTGANAAASEASVTDTAAVKQAFADFNAAIAAKDLPKIEAQYADDAVMVLPDQAPFEGVAAIMSDYKAYAADAAGKFVPGAESVTVSAGGDIAYGEVKYQSTYTNPKTKAVETSARYNLSVYRKQPDGSWKVVRDINATLPKAG
jgi:uncharacterized protein (TIGR02246 family)